MCQKGKVKVRIEQMMSQDGLSSLYFSSYIKALTSVHGGIGIKRIILHVFINIKIPIRRSRLYDVTSLIRPSLDLFQKGVGPG